MSVYLIGDVQGCDNALGRLLGALDFSPSRDTAYLLGDLVNRGPESLQVLRRLQGMGASARCVLGNHDLHAMGVFHGLRAAHRADTLAELLEAPDAQALMHWLRHQELAIHAHGALMVHAGVVPQWSLVDALEWGNRITCELRSGCFLEFLTGMYGNQPLSLQKGQDRMDQLRFAVNVLTRLRFCTTDGAVELETKGDATTAPPGFHPWFEAPNRQTAAQLVAFGHWSTVGLVNRPRLLGLDTGCAWGGTLTAAKLNANGERELIQVPFSDLKVRKNR